MNLAPGSPAARWVYVCKWFLLYAYKSILRVWNLRL